MRPVTGIGMTAEGAGVICHLCCKSAKLSCMSMAPGMELSWLAAHDSKE